ncbi:Cortactin-binding protein 2, partial [Symbiodinium microadriaticum]
MLRVRTASGEGLVVLDLASFHEMLPADVGPVRALKQHLNSICGMSRFRQRLVSLSDGAVLDDDHCLRTGEIQVVFLNFCPASGTQVAALRDAARSGRTSEVETLLHRPQDPDSGPPTPLFVAAEHGHLQVIRLVLEANADKDKADENGATPLYIAAQNGQLEVVRLLLEANVDKDKAKHSGATPLYIAAEKGQLTVVRLLLEANADKDKALED